MRSFVLCTYLIACTQVVQLAPDPLGNLVTIELTPNDATLTITDLSQPPLTLSYHAIGVFSDGSRRDITAMLDWSVDNGAPGGFPDPGTYTTSNAAAGHVAVTARSNDGVVATAALTVVVDAVVIDPAFPGDPTLFDPANPVVTGDPTHSPSYLYPSDGTQMPQGVASTLFQAALGTGNDTLELAFDADVLHLEVITAANRWDSGNQIEQLLALSSVGAPIACSIAAASSTATPVTVYAGAPISLVFDSTEPGGSLYFWSAATNGIMLGSLASPSAPKLFPSDASCVGCHSASRDGQSLAMGYGSETLPILQTINAATLATTIDRAAMIEGGWTTFSPDGTMVLVAGSGQLVLRDAQTGAPIGSGSDGSIELPGGHYATHPDWSPDGSEVAIAYTTTQPTDLSVNSASIAVLPYKGSGAFGAPIVVVDAVGLDNDYFPRFSPDGGYLAFVHASEQSQAAASAELWLVPSHGGTAIALEAASHTVSSVTGVAGIADTMPTWAPLSAQHTYLAFASSRAYGVVLPTAGQPQIWLSAIDLTDPTPASDPSQPAFWLPCQDVTVLNNNPVWAIDSTSPQ